MEEVTFCKKVFEENMGKLWDLISAVGDEADTTHCITTLAVNETENGTGADLHIITGALVQIQENLKNIEQLVGELEMQHKKVYFGTPEGYSPVK